MSTEIDTKELLREIAIKLDSAEDFRLGEVWRVLLRRAASAIDQLQKQIEIERGKSNITTFALTEFLRLQSTTEDDHR